MLRDFCRIYWQAVPDDTTLLRWANLIQPATLHRLLDHIVELAAQLQVTHGRKLRIDDTVVETNVHAPTDSSLLNDGVRVLSRTLKRAQACLGSAVDGAAGLFRDRTRSAKRLAKQIIDSARRRGEDAQECRHASYERLVEVGEAMVRQAQAVGDLLRAPGHAGAEKMAAQLEQLVPRVDAVLTQTKRRVLQGEKVPAGEKLVSLFEPETAIIRKGKVRQPPENGRMVWLGEVEGGIVSRYAVLAGNPADSGQVAPSLADHQRVFQRPPKILTADRGCWSEANATAAEAAGVKQVCLPKPGAQSAERAEHEKQAWFVRGRNWRAGIEGRIHALKRRYKRDRCLYHGTAGMERWVGGGVICHDLWRIAQVTATAA